MRSPMILGTYGQSPFGETQLDGFRPLSCPRTTRNTHNSEFVRDLARNEFLSMLEPASHQRVANALTLSIWLVPTGRTRSPLTWAGATTRPRSAATKALTPKVIFDTGRRGLLPRSHTCAPLAQCQGRTHWTLPEDGPSRGQTAGSDNDEARGHEGDKSRHSPASENR